MKKILTSITLIAALLCSCNKEEIAPSTEKTPDTGKQIITAKVNIASKAAYSENTAGGGGGLSAVWEEGDTFLALQDGNKIVTFTLSAGAGETAAAFTAETEGVTDETTWIAIFGENTTDHETEIHCSYQNQDGSLSNLDKCCYVKALGTGLEPIFDFENGEKLTYVVRVKLPAGVKCIEYTPSAYWKISSSETKAQYYTPTWYRVNDSMDTYAFAAYQADHTSVITLPSASTSGQIIYIAVPAINYSYTAEAITYTSTNKYGNLRAGVIITVMNDNSDNADASNGSVISADLRTKGGLVGTFDMSGMSLMKRIKPSEAISLTATAFTGVFTNINQKAEQYLLTKWSPINLGANEPYERGGLYSFGEINPRESFVLEEHSHYGHAEGYFDVLTAGSNLGGSITYTLAGSKYDAARVKWGVAWRMPHALELKALGQIPTRSDETVSGVTCLKLGVDNGKYLYLPLQTGTFYANLGYSSAGPWTAKAWAQGNACTFLRSADQPKRGNDSNTVRAWFFSYLSKASEDANNASGSQGDYWLGNYTNRHYGFPIRPVLASSEWER